MFEVIDLNGRPLPELKEIAKAFSIDSKGLAKNDIIMKIVDAQSGDADLAKNVREKFSAPKQQKNHQPKENRNQPQSQMDRREKRPRKVKLEPLNEEPV